MALDEISTTLLRQMADGGAQPFHTMTIDAARTFVNGLRPGFAGPAMHHVEDVRLGEGEQQFKLRLLQPCKEPKGVIVYYHGGGWVMLSIDDYDTLGRTLAAETGCAVVLVDYRLAPENRFPAAVDDAWLALQWAELQCRRFCADAPLPLIAVGDSAGGNLAAVVAQRAARAAHPALALQVLVYPVLQSDLSGPCYSAPENQTWMGASDMAWFWDHYLPDADLRRVPDASPLLATDLAGVAPALILTAEHDITRDEGEAYAGRLRDAGVPVMQQRFIGQMHGFFTLIHLLPVSRQGMDCVVAQINKTLAQHQRGSAQDSSSTGNNNLRGAHEL